MNGIIHDVFVGPVCGVLRVGFSVDLWRIWAQTHFWVSYGAAVNNTIAAHSSAVSALLDMKLHCTLLR